MQVCSFTDVPFPVPWNRLPLTAGQAMTTAYRMEKDSLGEVAVPATALYGAQTQRAVDNFRISSYRFPSVFIGALAQLKQASALANRDLGLLAPAKAQAIAEAATAVATGEYDSDFPLDIFQTGSGTSTNMNANEVIAALASRSLGQAVHPNDDVNMCQSSNDVIPSAMHVSTACAVNRDLVPALTRLETALVQKIQECGHVTKTGRTHLMDAMPVTLGQEMGGWKSQVAADLERVRSGLAGLMALPLGGTAVGTGINAHPEFSRSAIQHLAAITQLPFGPASDFFSGISAQDAMVDMSGRLRTVAVTLMKIGNDLRWMNSGPLAGLGEISLPALQPGSSIMPGKINPVIPEAITMVSAQVMGNDVTVGIAGQSGVFQLNVMLPVIAHNLLESTELLSRACDLLGAKAIAGFVVNEDRINESLARNPILVTALNPVIGYELGASIAKQAYAEKRSLKEVALERTDLTAAELDKLLDPSLLTQGGISS